MAREIFNKAERDFLTRFPAELNEKELEAYFTLSLSDRAQIPVKASKANRIGFAMLLCSMRYLGFIPDRLSESPARVVEYVGSQLSVSADDLNSYPKNENTRLIHIRKINSYLGFSRLTPSKEKEITDWLMKRALEHNKPRALFQSVCEKLKADQILRPAITTIERLILSVRKDAEKELSQKTSTFLNRKRIAALNRLLKNDEELGRTTLGWLRHGSTGNKSGDILEGIRKVGYLKQIGVQDWNLNFMNPNKLKYFARLGKKSSVMGLKRMPPQRRHLILLCFIYQALRNITDELVEMFDRYLMDAYARAKRKLFDFRISTAKSSNEKIKLFQSIGKAVLNQRIEDHALRDIIFSMVSKSSLEKALTECDQLVRPDDNNFFDFFSEKYPGIRRFSGKFLEALEFCCDDEKDPLILAVEIFKRENEGGHLALDNNMNLGFAGKSWHGYLWDESGKLNRKYFEMCVLWSLRNALRSGDIWLNWSRKYSDSKAWLIPVEQWADMRSKFCEITPTGQNGDVHLRGKAEELENMLDRVDTLLATGNKVSIINSKLSLLSLKALDEDPSVNHLQSTVTRQLPHVELSQLLIEVDKWTGLSRTFESLSQNKTKIPDFNKHLYAALIALGCNISLSRMAEIAGISYDQLAWINTCYLREETIQAANNILVNYQFRQPLSQQWGGGMLSSSDGQRFPAAVKTRNAAALPKYFGYGKGLTFYTWTSDQFSQYGSRVIPATMRDATFVLDAILDNETELEIMEHTTDTAGYSEIVFALFDLLGMKFSPRIRDVADQKIYWPRKKKKFRVLGPLLTKKLQTKKILESWDEILRLAASIRFGWVSASLMISRLQAYPRKSRLTKALQEYGRLVKSNFILNYIESEDYRRKIGKQLNKGEALHDLRRFLFFGNQAEIRKAQLEDQSNQNDCLTLLTNAVIVWNTRYIQAAVDGIPDLNEEDLKHLSPCRFEHINKYGKYNFDVEQEFSRQGLRELRMESSEI